MNNELKMEEGINLIEDIKIFLRKLDCGIEKYQERTVGVVIDRLESASKGDIDKLKCMFQKLDSLPIDVENGYVDEELLYKYKNFNTAVNA